MGKTSIAATVASQAARAGHLAVEMIRLSQSEYRSPLGVMGAIANASPQRFSRFLDELGAYRQSSGHSGLTTLEHLFVECLATNDETNKLTVVTLDSIEHVGPSYRRWLLGHLRSSRDIRILVTTRDPAALDVAQVVPVGLLESREAIALCALYGVEDSASLELLFARSGNSPLKLSTILEGLEADGNDGSSMNALAVSFESFYREIVHRMSATDVVGLRLMSVFRHGIASESLAPAAAISDPEALAAIGRLRMLPYVVSVNGTGAKLHDEMVGVVENVLSIESARRRELVEQALAGYYSPTRLATVNRTVRNRLVAERLTYEAHLRPTEAVMHLAAEIDAALAAQDVDHAEALLNAQQPELYEAHGRATLLLLRARLLLKRLEPTQAAQVLATVPREALELRPIHVAVLQLRAECVLGASPLPHGDRFVGVQLLQEAVQLAAEFTDSAVRGSLRLSVANGLRSVGRNDAALQEYQKVAAEAKTHGHDKLLVSAWQEMVQLHRLQQNLAAATESLREVHRLRSELAFVGEAAQMHYYSGNLYRDLDRFEEGRKQYRLAESGFRSNEDFFSLTCLLGDWAWLEYLAGALLDSSRMQDESLALASRYEFGTELAEYWHTRYHILWDEGEISTAYECLDQALAHARRATNVYMILDCLNHVAQRVEATADDKELGTAVASVSEVLREMEGIEHRGCGIRVFRYRAMLVLGDLYFRMEQYSRGYECWRDGLMGVAEFGSSRSNVELVTDLAEFRRSKIKFVVEYLRMSTALRQSWTERGHGDSFPILVQICDEIDSSVL